MDITAITSVLLPALAALGLIGNYLRGQARKDRVENRKLRQIVLDGDEWMFKQQRRAAKTGFTLDPIPTSWRALHDPDDEDPAPTVERAADEGARGSARHALREG